MNMDAKRGTRSGVESQFSEDLRGPSEGEDEEAGDFGIVRKTQKTSEFKIFEPNSRSKAIFFNP